MRTMIQQKVTRSGTMPDEVFNRIINNMHLECETGSDTDTISFDGRLTVEADEMVMYHINFYGTKRVNYILQFHKHKNYVKQIPAFGMPTIEKLAFTPGQIWQLQQIIERKRNENTIENILGFDPRTVFGKKMESKNIQFI